MGRKFSEGDRVVKTMGMGADVVGTIIGFQKGPFGIVVPGSSAIVKWDDGTTSDCFQSILRHWYPGSVVPIKR
jgi:hypothetical protein